MPNISFSGLWLTLIKMASRLYNISLVSMVTDISNKVLIGKTMHLRFLDCFDRILIILAGNEVIHKIFEFHQDQTTDY